ncbi:hypothetical protein C9374_013332 [Naegleria lovaniensis]|uniref:Uncharacterized protein n=1 Tax=Naegleria lovaniensis TaxID=51637 RepID=A0AA88H238_NAELO|nr:uncharacterized protein C9374_013332 [Naegleria lovaniensis]KAG2391847.1 hypothetical protein C9374_013332 [Naegleria lovaniensis]
MLKKCIEVMENVYGSFSNEVAYTPKALKSGTQTRYLWTDAFAVCNFLTLFIETNQDKYLRQAKALIDEVHNVLGKDRQLQRRLGNASDDHPLLGGLRIGKKYNEDHEDGDGQYFHYLTKWMFALNRMSLITGEELYNRWAIEMAESMHDRFMNRTSPHHLRMYWKISIDGSRPVVRSEGNLDPFDGYVTYKLLRNVHSLFHPSDKGDVLQKQIHEMERMVMKKFMNYSSYDPLDLGESLWISSWFSSEEWSQHIQKVALECLEELWTNENYFDNTSGGRRYRLAFREFGTSLGLQTIPPQTDEKWARRVQSIHEAWQDRIYERDRDITPVMYCSSIVPGVFKPNYCEQYYRNHFGSKSDIVANNP